MRTHPGQDFLHIFSSALSTALLVDVDGGFVAAATFLRTEGYRRTGTAIRTERARRNKRQQTHCGNRV